MQGEHLTTVVDEGVRIERQPAPGRSENGYGEQGVPAPVYRSPAAGKMYDSESLLLTLAKWCGMWAYVIED